MSESDCKLSLLTKLISSYIAFSLNRQRHQVLIYIGGWSIGPLLIKSRIRFCFRARLVEERKKWCENHPSGFWARPTKNSDSTLNMMRWEVGIPGKKGTAWAGGMYKLQMTFPQDYPSKPPKCKFTPPLFHPNLYPSGTVQLAILVAEHRWEPDITLEQIVLTIQNLLSEPNFCDPAQIEAYSVHKEDPDAYYRKVREQAKLMRPT